MRYAIYKVISDELTMYVYKRKHGSTNFQWGFTNSLGIASKFNDQTSADYRDAFEFATRNGRAPKIKELPE